MRTLNLSHVANVWRQKQLAHIDRWLEENLPLAEQAQEEAGYPETVLKQCKEPVCSRMTPLTASLMATSVYVCPDLVMASASVQCIPSLQLPLVRIVLNRWAVSSVVRSRSVRFRRAVYWAAAASCSGQLISTTQTDSLTAAASDLHRVPRSLYWNTIGTALAAQRCLARY
jgi:hypothetical protein